MRSRLGILLVLALAAALPVAPASAAPRGKCVFGYAGGEKQCLKVGSRCSASHKDDYLVAGFECRRRKLRTARAAVLRGPAPALLNDKGIPSFSTALQAFDATVANLPGVRRRPGVIGKSMDVSLALRSIMPYRDRLTRRQRAVVDRFFRRSTAARAAQADARLVQLVEEAKLRLMAYGLEFNYPIRVVEDATQLKGDEDTLAYAVPDFRSWRGAKPGTHCVVHITPRGASQLLAGPALLVHELVHCAEAEWFPNRDILGKIPWFVTEGFPNFAGVKVAMEWTGSAKPIDDDWWMHWFVRPHRPLLKRSYDALGFWALLEHEGVDPWTSYKASAIVGVARGDEAAYAAALAGSPTVQRFWGPTLHAEASAGRNWDLDGPAMPHYGSRFRPTIPIGENDVYAQAVSARGAWAVSLDISAHLVKVEPTSGVEGMLRTPDGQDLPLENVTYCTDPGGCVCPDGTDLELPHLQPGLSRLGYFSARDQGNVTVRAESIDRFCGVTPTLTGIEVLGPIPVGAEGTPEYQRLPLFERFKAITCRTRDGTLSATGSLGSTSVSLTVNGFPGFSSADEIYDFKLGATNPVVVFRGPGGPYSTAFPSPLPDAGFFGGLVGTDLYQGRALVGSSVIIMFNRAGNQAVQVGGAALCRRPRRP